MTGVGAAPYSIDVGLTNVAALHDTLASFSFFIHVVVPMFSQLSDLVHFSFDFPNKHQTNKSLKRTKKY